MATETPAVKVYIGDGVYAMRAPHGDVVLTTEDGYRATNTIVLEPGVIESLLVALRRWGVIQ